MNMVKQVFQQCKRNIYKRAIFFDVKNRLNFLRIYKQKVQI